MKPVTGTAEDEVINPHGMDLLEKNDYSLVKWQDPILFFVVAHEIADLDYTHNKTIKQFRDAIKIGKRDPFGPTWEGLFNIPICNVSTVSLIDNDFDHMDKILTPYGKQEEA